MRANVMSKSQWRLIVLAFALGACVAFTVDPARQGIFGSTDEKRQAIGQFRTTVLIWVAAFVAILIGLKLVHWYQTR
jgi:hypothetical protein